MTAERREIQVVHEPPAVRLAARTPAAPGEPEPAWLVHAAADVSAARQVKPDVLPDAGDLRPLDPGYVHQRLASVGVPSTGFDWTIGTLLGAEGALRATVHGERGSWSAALDAAMSVAPCVFPGEPVLRMVVRIDEVVLTGTPPATVIIDAAMDPEAEDTVRALIADVDGRVLGHLTGLRYPVIDAPAPAEDDPRGPAESFTGLSPEELRERVQPEVRAEIAAVMRLDPDDLALRRPLVEQGAGLGDDRHGPPPPGTALRLPPPGDPAVAAAHHHRDRHSPGRTPHRSPPGAGGPGRPDPDRRLIAG
ncbi:hypothetical protein [Nonomuraea salmonea]|uniref:hypothetical protein n=1 Tax=Nonomuraea salmonea TaxID=46181 RepID=UPI003CD093A8